MTKCLKMSICAPLALFAVPCAAASLQATYAGRVYDGVSTDFYPYSLSQIDPASGNTGTGVALYRNGPLLTLIGNSSFGGTSAYVEVLNHRVHDIDAVGSGAASDKLTISTPQPVSNGYFTFRLLTDTVVQTGPAAPMQFSSFSAQNTLRMTSLGRVLEFSERNTAINDGGSYSGEYLGSLYDNGVVMSVLPGLRTVRMNFTTGVPITLDYSSQCGVFSDSRTAGPEMSGYCATSLLWLGIDGVFDAHGRPVVGQTHGLSESGFDYGSFIGVAGIPEPASWALLIAGFGLAGSRLRSRRPRVLTACQLRGLDDRFDGNMASSQRRWTFLACASCWRSVRMPR